MEKNPFFFAQLFVTLSVFFLTSSGAASDLGSYAPLTLLQEHLLEGFIGVDHCSANQEESSSSPKKIIMDFQAYHKTCAWHWFPLQETRQGGDPLNNLYAKGGCLDKLDQVTGGMAREYEYKHNRTANDAYREYAWWGHCNNAAEAACILPQPKKSVVMRVKRYASLTPLQELLMEGFVGFELEIVLSRIDIQGLSVLMSPSLVDHIDFAGERSTSPAIFADQNDPIPERFLESMQTWSAAGLPFVTDIDRGERVWNYPYDHVRITKSDQASSRFDPSSLARNGSVKYYHIEMSGTGSDTKRRVYEFYMQRAADGHVIKSGWIKTPNTHNPDFIWRPHPIADIMNGQPSNPKIDPKTIYDNYMKYLESRDPCGLNEV